MPRRSTRIIASVLAASTEEMIRISREGTDGADIVELRVDGIESPDLDRLRSQVDKPLILTCRSAREGGRFRGGEAERLGVLVRALDLGFDFVDIETDSSAESLWSRATRSKRIASCHVFEKSEVAASDLVAKAIRLAPEVVKVAVSGTSFEDALELADAGAAARKRGIAYCPVLMGPEGVAARVLSSRLGTDFVYASARGSPATGPGQLGLEDLLTLYRFRSIGPATRVYGIVGHPVAASLSPALHNDHLGRAGIDGVYVPFEEKILDRFVRAARRFGIDGFSVTRPHKEAILSFVEHADDEAASVGAANTVLRQEGKWVAYNTDIDGVVGPILRRTGISGRRAVVLGAGGAARAAAYGLRRQGAEVMVLARRIEQARRVAGLVQGRPGTLDQLETLDWDILVQATPVGGSETRGRLPAPIRRVRAGSVVLDMIYEPERTALLDAAENLGATPITGLEMLLAQAVRQAEIWTGVAPSMERLESAARRELERRRAR